MNAIAEDGRLRDVESWHYLRSGTQMDQTLAESLEKFLPDAADALCRRDDSSYPPYIPPLLFLLLDQIEGDSTERKPVLLLAADRLADRLRHDEESTPEWDALREQLAKRGLDYVRDHLGGQWVYTNDLLWEVWRAYPKTIRGEYAFARLAAFGWDTSGQCVKGCDQFREVIRRGEQFLATAPKSMQRSRVLLMVAQAYETWWSLSQAQDDEYIRRSLYEKDSERARQKSILYYEQVERFFGQSDETLYARRRLPLLRHRLDGT